MTRSPAGVEGYEMRPVRVVLAAGAANRLASELAGLEVRRPLLITTAGRSRLAQSIMGSLEPGAELFSGARLHVPAEVVASALERARQHAADALVAIGGGSAIGVAKAVALQTSLPVVAIPTTYSGSEMTSIWGTTAGREKKTGRDERVAPRVVVYDPLLTLDLDAVTSSASGMNAIAHCVEALYAPDANPLASLFAEEGIRAMASAQRRLVAAPRDLEARTLALHAAHLAGRALDMTTMGLHHKLCHVLGGLFGLPHAATHAALLPHIVAWAVPAASAAGSVIARALANRDMSAGSDPGRAPDAGDAASGLLALEQSIGLRSTLADLGFTEAGIDRVAAHIARAGIVHPRPVTVDHVRRILRAAL